jgi:hypothetical protein
MAVGPDEAVYVLDVLLRRLQIYDRGGNYLSTIGRQGYGPGEFQSPWRLAVTSRGEIVIRDLQLERYNVFGSDKSYRGARPAKNDGSYWDHMRSDTLGYAYDARRSWDDRSLPHMVFRFTANDSSFLENGRQIPREPRDEVILPDRLGYVDQPFRRKVFWTVGPDGTIWSATGGKYEIMGVTPQDDTVRIAGSPRNVPIPPARRDSVYVAAAERIRALMEKDGRSPAPLLRQLRRPVTYPPLQALAVDRQGRVWAGMPHEAGTPWVEFEIYSPQGELQTIARFPADRGLMFESMAFGNSIVAVLSVSDLDVDRVVVFDLPDRLTP